MRRSEVVLPDYANEETNERDIQKVGVRNIWLARKWGEREVITNQSVYVSLEKMKGIHMSRLTSLLEEKEGDEIEIDDEFLNAIEETHKARDVYWKCEWSDIFRGEQRFMVDLQLEGRKIGNEYRWYLSFVIPYASVCPCSMNMCKAIGEGIPHMQRSKVRVTVEVKDKTIDLNWLVTYMILDVINVVVLVPTLVMTREEELEWCKRAEKVNLFVEDVVRKVADVVDKWEWIRDWVICAEHEESIHQHNACAIIWKGLELR